MRSNLNGRLNRLEQKSKYRDMPWLLLFQDLDDPDLFRDAADNEYRQGRNWPGNHVHLLCITYMQEWRGESLPLAEL